MPRKAKWAICPACNGDGTSSAHLGAITGDEWNGPDWDDDSREMYLSGGYDKPCTKCDGTGKVDLNASRPERDAAYESERWLRYAETGAMS